MVTLTSLELKLLKLVISEKSSAQIAEKLKLSLSTTERIKTSLYRKTRTKSGIGLLKWAIKNKLYTV